MSSRKRQSARARTGNSTGHRNRPALKVVSPALPPMLRRDGAVKQIRELIERLSPENGERLPSERKLAEQFGLSRGTVREALQFLAALDLVEIRHGGGCFVRAPSDGGLRTRWRNWVSEHRGEVLESLEVRLGCEMFAVRLAARRAGPADLAQLVETLKGMKVAGETGDVATFLQSNLAFHAGVLRASGNTILQELVGALGKDLIAERAAILDISGRAARSLAEHTAIYRAIQSGNAQAGAAAMYAHLESVRRDLLRHLLDDSDAAQAKSHLTAITLNDLSGTLP